ncbi:unnamed protein product [Strongylus vulgaris]|uniref:Uncharacterized protein n=1 Tax=Strongylus vulgaris TaxID=40348 RepID=A0A3P7KS86_STRVU|nr:unnamed protein product [Strongylus vulgaris]
MTIINETKFRRREMLGTLQEVSIVCMEVLLKTIRELDHYCFVSTALDNGAFYDARGGYVPRGGYVGRGRGGIVASPRGGYSPRGDAYPTRGFTGPKRYSEQRGEILPPPAPIAVPPPIPPPQHNFSMPRQPTDVVYFDPTQQVSCEITLSRDTGDSFGSAFYQKQFAHYAMRDFRHVGDSSALCARSRSEYHH